MPITRSENETVSGRVNLKAVSGILHGSCAIRADPDVAFVITYDLSKIAVHLIIQWQCPAHRIGFRLVPVYAVLSNDPAEPEVVKAQVTGVVAG